MGEKSRDLKKHVIGATLGNLKDAGSMNSDKISKRNTSHRGSIYRSQSPKEEPPESNNVSEMDSLQGVTAEYNLTRLNNQYGELYQNAREKDKNTGQLVSLIDIENRIVVLFWR